MGNFCTQCGKRLEEGQTCDCQSAAQQQAYTQVPPPPAAQQQAYTQVPPPPAAQQQVYTQVPPPPAVQQQAYTQAPPPSPAVQQQTYTQVPPQPVMQGQAGQQVQIVHAEGYLKKLTDTVVRILKSPDKALGEFVGTKNSQIAIGIMVVQGLLFAAYMAALFSKVNSLLQTYFSLFSGALSELEDALNYFGGSSEMLKFPLTKIFVISFILMVGLSLLFAGILLVVDKAFFRGETSYTHMLCASSGRSAALIPVTAAAIIVGFISPAWGLAVLMAGDILGYFFTGAALKAASTTESNKRIYCLFISVVIFGILTGIVIKIIYPMYLPETLKTAIQTMKSMKGFGL
ncbi:YIP1 family protein [Anaerocolumna xylanovorans]|uniref:Yip1 domain-containing protein n=1 Tax=Anaerocolumna xylanovorans DSM 12503 TaxID=1121345 RepID=A0A1M7Y4E2_9FIRM|nr:YIP1 family protein [Anaerocolumna xylanovorans]SHO47105.1 hypothetical protein SAMN02745217_01409 [Anaerocolumna xylanovorans DSM 12503]